MIWLYSYLLGYLLAFVMMFIIVNHTIGKKDYYYNTNLAIAVLLSFLSWYIVLTLPIAILIHYYKDYFVYQFTIGKQN
jgi:hypothetical protein